MATLGTVPRLTGFAPQLRVDDLARSITFDRVIARVFDAEA